MAKKTKAIETTAIAAPEGIPGLRRCIGSTRYGIEAHEAPVEDFPRQPSQKDGLGRMCKTHWNQYTTGLARDAKARKASDGATATEPGESVAIDAPPVERPAARTRRRIASTGQGNRYAESIEAADLSSANSQDDAG